MAAMSSPGPSRRAQIGLATGFGVFVLAIGFLVASSLVPRDVLEFEITPRAARAVPPESLVIDTVTLDAGSDRAWRFFSFASGAALDVPDTAGWDLAFRRFHVMASGDAIDLGPVGFGAVTEAPADGYRATRFGADTANAALTRWYRYSLFSHVLEPKGHVYAIRTRDGHYAKVEFLGYYCPGTVPGCVTLRYAYQGNGSRRLR